MIDEIEIRSPRRRIKMVLDTSGTQLALKAYFALPPCRGRARFECFSYIFRDGALALADYCDAAEYPDVDDTVRAWTAKNDALLRRLGARTLRARIRDRQRSHAEEMKQLERTLTELQHPPATRAA
jgi:hypothetical protein